MSDEVIDEVYPLDSVDVLTDIINKTDSTIILFCIALVVLATVLIAGFIPLYKTMKTNQRAATKDTWEQNSLREQQLIRVLTDNTEAITSLRIALDSFGTSMVDSIKRVHDRLDGLIDLRTEDHSKLSKISLSVIEMKNDIEIIKVSSQKNLQILKQLQAIQTNTLVNINSEEAEIDAG